CAGSPQVGYSPAGTGSLVTCYLYGGSVVNGGDTVVVTLNGVNNPTTTGAHTLTIATSSDTPSVTSPKYTVTPAAAVTAASVAVSKNLTSATGVTYTVKFKAAPG